MHDRHRSNEQPLNPMLKSKPPNPRILPDELTQDQKRILALAINIIGFQVPVLGKGIKTVHIKPEDIKGVFLYDDTYELKTTFGTNHFQRTVFKAAVNIYK